jgi:hypothetical protein
MAWPAPDEYSEAVQNPESCFADSDLRNGFAACNAWGLPIVSTGAFASVYRFRTGNKDFAVRCFLRENRERQERYRKIAHFVHNDSLPWTVDFNYLKEGIRVGAKWYPILKMEWVEGELFSQYIERHLQNSEQLLLLADRFKEMTLGLKQEGVAHGDLQHGNMIMCGDDIRLVDYDGMFVPALAGDYSHELGHPNYQHPNRAREHFGAYLDNFSSWIIFLGLHCVSYDPTLWQLFNGGDERLLLCRADFASPNKSIALSQMLSHQVREVRTYAEVVLTLIEMPPEQIPSLDEALNGSCKPSFSRVLQKLSLRATGAWQSLSRLTRNWKPLSTKQEDSDSRPERGDRWYQQPDWVISQKLQVEPAQGEWYQDWVHQPIVKSTKPLGHLFQQSIKNSIPSTQEWRRLTFIEQQELSQKIPDIEVLNALKSPKLGTFVAAVAISTTKACQGEFSARLFCCALVEAMIRLIEPDIDTLSPLLLSNLALLFANCSQYCYSRPVPDWLSKSYFEALDFALQRPATQISTSSLLAYLRSWVLMTSMDLQLLEEFLLSRIHDRSLSDDYRVRAIYAAKQLLQIYHSRLMKADLVRDYVSRLSTALTSISQDKQCSLFLLMVANDTMSTLW